MTSCSPKCKDDTECIGQKCCPNICNAKSCVPQNLLSADSGSGTYKGSISSTEIIHLYISLNKSSI